MMTRDRDAKEYTRPLPGYAQKASSRRLVRVLCKGRCSMIRWAEMEVDYPGRDILKKALAGDYKARCLKCGYLARDPYNWYR